MNWLEACKAGEESLRKAGIEDAATDSWLLLEYAGKIDRSWYLMNRQQEVPKNILDSYQSFLERRMQHIPLQHITGVQEFMGLDFFVSDAVLIPRQDTETLVEQAIRRARPGMRVLDLCTGSGCILLSLMHEVERLEGWGSDVSSEALWIAKKNAENLSITIHLLLGDLFESVSGTFDIIVSNPPYIATREIEELAEEVRSHDPLIALDGKEDGLYFYRRIVSDSPKYLKQSGWLLFEIGYDQGAAVAAMMRQAGFLEVEIEKDLAGCDRVVYGHR